MTQARYQHSFNLTESLEKRLAKLIQKGIKIIEVIEAGIEEKEKDK